MTDMNAHPVTLAVLMQQIKNTVGINDGTDQPPVGVVDEYRYAVDQPLTALHQIERALQQW